MLSASYNFYHQKSLLGAFQANSRNSFARNPSMVTPLLANQDLTPILAKLEKILSISKCWRKCIEHCKHVANFFYLNLLANMVAKLGNIVGQHIKLNMFANNDA